MRLKDVSLKNIKEYFDNCSYDGLIKTEIEKDKDLGEILYLYRFDGEYDDENTYVCLIYKASDGDFIVETDTSSNPFNFGEGIIGEDEDVEIDTIIRMMLSEAKSGICENIDFQKRQTEFINDFGKQCGLEISSVTTTTGSKYE